MRNRKRFYESTNVTDSRVMNILNNSKLPFMNNYNSDEYHALLETPIGAYSIYVNLNRNTWSILSEDNQYFATDNSIGRESHDMNDFVFVVGSIANSSKPERELAAFILADAGFTEETPLKIYELETDIGKTHRYIRVNLAVGSVTVEDSTRLPADNVFKFVRG